MQQIACFLPFCDTRELENIIKAEFSRFYDTDEALQCNKLLVFSHFMISGGKAPKYLKIKIFPILRYKPLAEGHQTHTKH